MLNQVILVGRLVKEPTLKEGEKKKVSFITLAVPRSYKNLDGEYDTDFVECVVFDGIASNVCEYCHKGDLVGIKGRLQRLSGEQLTVVAEKVTFLSSREDKEE